MSRDALTISPAARWGWLVAALVVAVSVSPAVGRPFPECERTASFRELGDCYCEKAEDSGRWREAGTRLDELLQRHGGDPYLLFYRGYIEEAAGDKRRAIELYRAAASAAERRGAHEYEFYCYNNISKAFLSLGRIEDAEDALAEAAAVKRGFDDPVGALRVELQRVRLMRVRGEELERALRRISQLEKEAEGLDSADLHDDLLHERVTLLNLLGRTRQALRQVERWHREVAVRDDDYTQAGVLALWSLNLANLREGARERKRLEELVERTLDLGTRTGNLPAELKARELLGQLVQGEEGRRQLELCAERAEAAGILSQACQCLFALSEIVVTEPGGMSEALDLLDRALRLSIEDADPWVGLYGWAERSRVRWATLPPDEALDDALTIVDLVETLRDLQAAESGRLDVLSGWSDLYYHLAGQLLRTEGGRPEATQRAFAIAERLRGRVLLEHLRARQEPRATELDEATSSLLRDVVGIQRRLLDPDLPEVEREVSIAELEDLEREIAARSAPGPLAAASADLADLSDVEGELAPDEVVLSFLFAPDRDVFGRFAGGSWLFATTSSGTRVYRLRDSLEIEARVGHLVRLVEAGKPVAAAAARLHTELLAPALEELPSGIDRLVIVPDGQSHRLPFSLLGPEDGPLLSERYQITLVPSATLWLDWRRREAPAHRAPVLALADPAFLNAGDVAGSEPPIRAWSRLGAPPSRLPRAPHEGRIVLGHLGGDGRLLAGEEATERFLKTAPLGDYAVLHFAAHALLDEEHPRRSAILLAPGASEEDGLLQPREIVRLGLDGQLVVLSACQSAVGRVQLGEGTMSLARAFFQAGARVVLGTLWPVADEDAERFLDLFYDELGEGASVASALATAQREARRRGMAPAAWAGMVVLGDGDLVPFPGGVGVSVKQVLRAALAGSLLLLALVLTAVAWRRRRRLA